MFAGESYRITTTCTPTGSIIVEMTYCDEEIPTGTEETLCIYHWDADTETWEDITVSRDTVNNIVVGITDSLSPFGMTIPQRFSDVTFGNWAFLYIEACFRAGILGGYDDGTYRPAEPVDRASMAVYISRALAGGDDHIPTGPATATFTDVLTDHWAYKYVEYAYANDIVQGYGADVYAPAVTVDRAQMAVFIARAIVTPTDRPDLPSYTPPETATFSDVATDHWAYKYVEYIAQDAVAVSQGYDDGTYRPDVIVTRDQMAVYVQRAFELSM
jgi:hypothetical protein